MLPVIVSTPFPLYTSHLLRYLSYISLASPFTWPWSCWKKGSHSFYFYLSSVLPLNHWTMMELVTILPLCFLLCYTSLFVLYYEVLYLQEQTWKRKIQQFLLSIRYYSFIISLYFCAIGGISYALFTSIECVDLDPYHTISSSSSSSSSGLKVLWIEPQLVCSGSLYTYSIFWSVIAILCYLVIIPVSVISFMIMLFFHV
jgi:hypothetical protein